MGIDVPAPIDRYTGSQQYSPTMDDFKVPTVQLATELHCVDGAVLRGHVYMAALSAIHAGAMTPQEWINSPPAFFPFRQEDGTTVLVNKYQVLAMSVAAPPPAADEQAWQPPELVRHAIVEAGGKRFGGDVVIDMPENQRRLVDYLNRTESFLCLVCGENRVLVRKERVARATEVEETPWK
jgi:hypothetical protein